MSKKISLGTTLIIIAFSIIITFQVTFLFASNSYRKEIMEKVGGDGGEGYFWNTKIKNINEVREYFYLYDADETIIIEEMAKAYVNALGDKYSYYMTSKEYNSFMSENNGDMQGIGVYVIYNSELGSLEIVSVMSDSPALEAGVRAGDLITHVGDEYVSELGYYNSLEKMRGEAGTVTEFTVLRPEANTYIQLEFSIMRGYIVQETVQYRLYDDNETGIIRILQFDLETPSQFFDAIEKLQEEGAVQFVFDLRYNPGGDLRSIVEILDFLLPEGPIIRIIDRNGEETMEKSDANEFVAPFSVITNNSTASAAELFTAALRDYDKAVVVGDTTYGKGTMQTIMKLPDGSAISITTGTYCPPYSDNYNDVGITPDVEVSLPEEYSNISIYKLTDEQDTQLQEALAVFRND